MSEPKNEIVKKRATINLPAPAHLQLSRIAIKVRTKKGHPIYKQQLLASMIAYFYKKPELLTELV